MLINSLILEFTIRGCDLFFNPTLLELNDCKPDYYG